MVRSKTEPGKPFVRFERAVAIQLKPDAQVNREGLERAILNELRARYVVSGIEPRLTWQDESDVRFVAQSLLEQGAAYAVSSNCLVLASSKEFLGDILQAAKAPRRAVDAAEGPVQSLVLLRVASAKPVFDILMSKLDGGEDGGTTARKPEIRIRIERSNFSAKTCRACSIVIDCRSPPCSPRIGTLLTERVDYIW